MKKYISIGVNELDTYLDYAILSIMAIYSLHSTPSEMGILGACFAIPFLVASGLFGRLFDNGNILKWRMLLFFINGIVMPFLSVADPIIFLYVITLIKTTCRCGLGISNTKLNVDDNESQRFYEIYGYITNFSRIAIPLFVVYLNTYYGLWFVLSLSMTFNLVGMLTSYFDNTFRLDENKGINSTAVERFSLIQQLKSKPDLYLLVSAYTLSNLAFFLSNDMLGIFFEKIGQSESSIGYIISLLGVGGIIGTRISGWLLKRLSAKSLLLFSVMVNFAAFWGFGFLDAKTNHYATYYLLVFLVGTASGVTFFAIRYGIRNIIGFEHVGKATGGIQKISSVVAILMPIIGGYIAKLISIEFTFKLTSILLAVIFLYFLFKKCKLTEKRNMYV
ncbi:MFS transporter [Photorhabdus temperata subsp. temperata]